MLGQARSTQRYQSTRAEGNADLTQQMKTLAAENPRYGYRRVAALLRHDGWAVNLKRVHRLWKHAGLQVPQKQRKRRRIDGSDDAVRLAAAYLNHVWSYDFLFDTTENGRTVKLLAVVDEYTRECLALEAARSIKSGDVSKVVDRIATVRGYPDHVRSDNGPEFIAKALQEHLDDADAETRYIDPGAPWQNAYVESFNGKLRDELLARESFGTLAEAQVLVAAWRRHYNESRPHSSLRYQTPAAFAAAYSTPAVALNIATGTKIGAGQHERARRATAVSFLDALIELMPYKIHTVLTDNGIQFTHRKSDRYTFKHAFARICDAHGIEHRLTKPNHP